MSTELSITPVNGTMGDNTSSTVKPSTTPPKDRVVDTKEPSRISRKRTKTGCLTCRRRRIKCGEEKPHCNNCIKSKRCCDYKARAAFRRYPFNHIQDTNNYNYQPMPMSAPGYSGHQSYEYHMSGFPYGGHSQSPLVSLPPQYTQSPSFMGSSFSHGRSASCDTLPPFWSGSSFHTGSESSNEGSGMAYSVPGVTSQSYTSSPTSSAEPQSAPMPWTSDGSKAGRPALSKIMTDSPQSRDLNSFHSSSRIQKRPHLSSLSVGRRTVGDWYGYHFQDERNRHDFNAPATAPPFRQEHHSPYPWTSMTPDSDVTTPSSARPDLSSGLDNPLFASEPMSAPHYGGVVSPFSPDMSRWLPSKSCMSQHDVKPLFEHNIKELSADDSFEQLLEPRTPMDAQHPQQSMMSAKIAT